MRHARHIYSGELMAPDLLSEIVLIAIVLLVIGSLMFVFLPTLR